MVAERERGCGRTWTGRASGINSAGSSVPGKTLSPRGRDSAGDHAHAKGPRAPLSSVAAGRSVVCPCGAFCPSALDHVRRFESLTNGSRRYHRKCRSRCDVAIPPSNDHRLLVNGDAITLSHIRTRRLGQGGPGFTCLLDIFNWADTNADTAPLQFVEYANQSHLAETVQCSSVERRARAFASDSEDDLLWF